MEDQRRWTLTGSWDSSGPDSRWIETTVEGPDLKPYEEVHVIEAAVTDAMVDQTCEVHFYEAKRDPPEPDRRAMRLALEAALTPPAAESRQQDTRRCPTPAAASGPTDNPATSLPPRPAPSPAS